MGPYHPALPQPLGLTFKLRGERIVGVERPITGYCRRDIESLVIGQSQDDALRIVERACAWSGHSYRTALAQALEAATGATPSARAALARSVFAEVERILARLWLLEQVARAGNVQAAVRDALEARERFYDALTRTTGERHYWGVSEVGGVRTLDAPDLKPLAAAVDEFGATVESWELAAAPRGVLGKLGADVGRLTQEQAHDRRISSVAARAAGVTDDLRRDAPYGGYALATVDWPDATEGARKGDVAARCAVAAHDLAASVVAAGALLRALDDASDASGATKRAAASAKAGSAKLEAPHGIVDVFAGVAADGTVASFRLNTPGPESLAVLPMVLEGQPVGASALIIASLDICVECLDH
jgi:Ni,Fe-hydrogenase III large subunit